MNKLKLDKQVAVIAALVEGNSIRGTARLTGVDKNTVMSLLVQVGTACKDYQDKVFSRIHTSLRCTPAMRAKVTNRLWRIEDIIKLLK